MTYTAADGRGHIIGGGISPGIESRFNVMTLEAPALPEITIDELKKRIQKAIFSNLPIPLFARDTKDAMVVSVLSELLHALDRIIQMWLERTNDSKTSMISRTVFITGGSGEILRELLGVNRVKIIDVLKSEGGNRVPFKIDLQPCLVHKGMATVILNGSELSNSSKMSSLLPSLIGDQELSSFALSFVHKKVANKFKGIVLTGTVTKVTHDDRDYIYHIHYESGYTETVDLVELKNLIDNFHHIEALAQQPPKDKKRSASAISENSERMPKARKTQGKESASTPRLNNGNDDVLDVDAACNVDLSTESAERKAKDSLKSKGRKAQDNESVTIPPPAAAPDDTDADPSSAKAQKLLHRPRDLIGLRVMRFFIDESTKEYLPFYGTVDDYEYVEQTNEKLWHIAYDDGDGEHCDHNELYVVLKQYKKHRDQDPNLPAKRK